MKFRPLILCITLFLLLSGCDGVNLVFQETEPNDLMANAAYVRLGGNKIYGEISSGTDIDSYVFDLPVETLVLIKIEWSSGEDFDPAYDLCLADGTYITTFNDYTEKTDEFLRLYTMVPDNFGIQVYGVGNTQGSYTVTIQKW